MGTPTFGSSGGSGGGVATCASSPQLLCLAGRTGTTNDPLISTDADGTITGSGASAGSLIFKSSSTATPGKVVIEASDGTGAFFDHNDLGNPRLLIGTATDPTSVISGAGVAEILCFSNSLGDDGWFFATSYIFGAVVTSNTVGVAPQFLGTRARGTLAAILPVADLDILFQATGNGISSDGSLGSVSSTIAFVVDGAPSPGVVSSGFSIGVVETTGSRVSRFNIDRDGRVGIGGQVGLIPAFRAGDTRRAGALFHVQSILDTEPTSIVQALASQTQNLTEWWDSANTPLTVVDPNGVGVFGAAAPTNVSVGLEVQSTTRVLLVSRMTTTQKNALTAVNGMIVYDSTLNKFQGYENGAWTNFI